MLRSWFDWVIILWIFPLLKIYIYTILVCVTHIVVSSTGVQKLGRSNHCHFFCILPCFPSLYSSTLQVALETVKAQQRGLRIGEVLMCNCLGLRGIQNRARLIPWNAIIQGTLHAYFSFWHTQIQFILWPRGSESLPLFHHLQYKPQHSIL